MSNWNHRKRNQGNKPPEQDFLVLFTQAQVGMAPEKHFFSGYITQVESIIIWEN